MRYWVFHEQMLDQALAEFLARRVREGASEQQAADEATQIKLFLGSNEATKLLGGKA